jgi:hypothetical protein
VSPSVRECGHRDEEDERGLVLDVAAAVVVGLGADLNAILTFLLQRPHREHHPLAVLHADTERDPWLCPLPGARPRLLQHGEGGVWQQLAELVVGDEVDEVLVRGDAVSQRHHAELHDVSVAGAARARGGGLGALQHTVPETMATYSGLTQYST